MWEGDLGELTYLYFPIDCSLGLAEYWSPQRWRGWGTGGGGGGAAPAGGGGRARC